MGNTYLVFLSIFVVCLQTSRSETRYECVDVPDPQTRIFTTLESYRQNTESFQSGNNYVEFSADKIENLYTNSFVAHDSNFIRKLILNEKQIRHISKQAFNELYCTKYLMLQNNHVYRIENGTFNGLFSVEVLNLSYNDIKYIPSAAFWNLSHLLKLDLSYNQIKNLTSNTFASLANLWELNLKHNDIIYLPSEIFSRTPRLRKLFLGNNRISVPTTPDFRFLEQLIELDLSNNGISYIFENMLRPLQKLSILDVSGNHLTQLNIRMLHMCAPAVVRLDINGNPWPCFELQSMISYMEMDHIGVVINNVTVYEGISISEIGCINGSIPITVSTSTTTVAPTTTSATTYNTPSDNSVVLEAVNHLKYVVIVFIVVIVIMIVADGMYKMYPFALFRRFNSQSGRYDPSLPLLSH